MTGPLTIAGGATATEAAGGPSTIEAAVVTLLVALGTFFLLVGTVGLLRLPNVFNRMHATSKATTLGASSMLLAAAVYFGPEADPSLPGSGLVPGGYGLVSLVCIVFLFATAPTGAHVISRSAQKMGIPFTGIAAWPAAVEDDDAPVHPDEASDDADSSADQSADDGDVAATDSSVETAGSDEGEDDSSDVVDGSDDRAGSAADDGVTETTIDDDPAASSADEDADSDDESS